MPKLTSCLKLRMLYLSFLVAFTKKRGGFFVLFADGRIDLRTATSSHILFFGILVSRSFTRDILMGKK